jgi:hypothetical protein
MESMVTSTGVTAVPEINSCQSLFAAHLAHFHEHLLCTKFMAQNTNSCTSLMHILLIILAIYVWLHVYWQCDPTPVLS